MTRKPPFVPNAYDPSLFIPSSIRAITDRHFPDFCQSLSRRSVTFVRPDIMRRRAPRISSPLRLWPSNVTSHNHRRIVVRAELHPQSCPLISKGEMGKYPIFVQTYSFRDWVDDFHNKCYSRRQSLHSCLYDKFSRKR